MDRHGKLAIVVSVHGIRTRGLWQRKLVPILNRAGYHAAPLDYGRFGVLRLLVPALRRRKIDWFRDQWGNSTEGYPARHIIAHSFGTYIVSRAFEIYPELRCDRLILCGSIVRCDYSWELLQARGQVQRVLNDFGKLDVWSRFVEWVVEDAGPSGAVGFKSDSPALVQREHPEFRHSDYFYKENFEQNWLRFLGAEDPPLQLPRLSKGRNVRYFIVRALVGVITLSAMILGVQSLIRRYNRDEGTIERPPGQDGTVQERVTQSDPIESTVQPIQVPEEIPPVDVPSDPIEPTVQPVEVPEEIPPVGVPGGVQNDEPLRVGGDVTRPEKISGPNPAYTEMARAARVTGTVIIDAIIDESGNVIKARVLKGLPMDLDRAAVEAIQNWKFKPATLHGRPVKVYYTLSVNFNVE